VDAASAEVGVIGGAPGNICRPSTTTSLNGGACDLAGTEDCAQAESDKNADKNTMAADRKHAILEPVRNVPALCFERVTSLSVCEPEPVRNVLGCAFVAPGIVPQPEARADESARKEQVTGVDFLERRKTDCVDVITACAGSPAQALCVFGVVAGRSSAKAKARAGESARKV